MNDTLAKRLPGRPRKHHAPPGEERPRNPQTEPCPCCNEGKIEFHEEVVIENDQTTTQTVLRDCEACNGSGRRPVGPFKPEDVSDADLLEIEHSLGCMANAWGFVDPKKIVAAAANRMGRRAGA